MNWLIVPTENAPDLASLNDQFEDRQCTAIPDENGVLLTGADKLSPENEQYWGAYWPFLQSLDPFEGEPVWPAPALDF